MTVTPAQRAIAASGGAAHRPKKEKEEMLPCMMCPKTFLNEKKMKLYTKKTVLVSMTVFLWRHRQIVYSVTD